MAVDFKESCSSIVERFSSKLELSPLAELPMSLPRTTLSTLPIQLEKDGVYISLQLHTYRPAIGFNERVVFVFLGRKEQGYVPRIDEDSGIRVILVGPQTEFELLQGYLSGHIDYLVVEHLESPSHGVYADVTSITSRRLGAFVAALYLQAQHQIKDVLMMDDNIKSLHGQAGTETWVDYISKMAQEAARMNSVCVSLATIANKGLRENRQGELGSKVFLFAMEPLSARFLEPKDYFLPFFPALGASYWGEDYYFQLMFLACFKSQQLQGFGVLDPVIYGIQRASALSLCRRVCAQRGRLM